MFAIEISDKNLREIFSSLPNLSDDNVQLIESRARTSRPWYAITGYVDDRGRVLDWTVLPKFILDAGYVYDPIYASYTWDQIVRK